MKTTNQSAPQTVVIIGATRGLGLDLLRGYAARGARLAVCARDALELLRVEAELRDTELLVEACDAAKPEQMERFMRDVVLRFGRIDVLITCAATIQVGPLETMSTSDFEAAMEQIFWTTYHPTMAVLPHMRAQRAGSIAHVASFAGKVPVPHMLPYTTAKFAVTGFSMGLHAELKKEGIHVTTISPGLLRTGSYVNVPFKGQQEKEYIWFAGGGVTPLLSMPSERAARLVMRAIDKKASERTLSWAVRAAAVTQAAAPSVLSKVLVLADRLLPSGGSRYALRGSELASLSRSRWVQAIARYGKANAERHHEYPGPVNIVTSVERELYAEM